MKVYIVIESCDEIIRFATLRKDIAEDICNSFGHINFIIKEMDLVGIDK